MLGNIYFLVLSVFFLYHCGIEPSKPIEKRQQTAEAKPEVDKAATDPNANEPVTNDTKAQNAAIDTTDQTSNPAVDQGNVVVDEVASAPGPAPTPTPIPSFGLVSYDSDLKPWIDSKCVSCHPTEHNLDFRTYAGVRTVANQVVKKVKSDHEGPYTKAEKDLVIKWQADGFLEK